MAHLDLQRGTYAAASTLLGSRVSRRIGHNTILQRDPRGQTGAIAVRYHTTDVVTLTADGWLEMNTGGWHTVTTWQRINALLPGPWRVGSDRGTPWLWFRGRKVTPYTDGLSVNADAGSVGMGSDTLLTADDVAAIVAAEDDRAAERARKRIARLLREHPTARTFPPDASGLFAQYSAGPGGPHRGYSGRSHDCPTCTAEGIAWRDLRRDALARSHDGLTLTLPGGGTATYPAHATLTSYGRSGCPYDCPKRPYPDRY